MKILEISVHDYKGGEPGEPEIHDTYTDFVMRNDYVYELMFDDNNNVLEIEELKEVVLNKLTEMFENIYAGGGTVYKLYELKGYSLRESDYDWENIIDWDKLRQYALEN